MTDLIGVETAIKVVEQALDEGADYRKRLRMIPAKREIRGHWEKDSDTAFYWKCSECGAYLYLLRAEDKAFYCPNCGAHMEE